MKILTIGILLSLVGCAGTPVKLFDNPNLTLDKVARITTSCNSTCEDAIELDGRYQINDGLLLEVDGKVGKRKVRNGLAFNSSLDGSLNLEVESGIHELVVDHNSRLVRGKPEKFKAELLGGHSYAVGRVRVEYIKNLAYRWYPYVYDLTSQRLIYSNKQFFTRSANRTCMARKKNFEYCSCYVDLLNQSMSYSERESVIMDKKGSVNLVLDKMNENSDQLKICKNKL